MRTPWFSPEQLAVVKSVAGIIQRVCGMEYRQAFRIAKTSVVFNAPKRYAGGRTVVKGYE